MILDNSKDRKVHEWIEEYVEKGAIDIVTGYFTIATLAYISQKINQQTAKFRLVFGDIVNFDREEHRTLDLLNENITIEAALKLNRVAQEAVEFLKQDKVLAKTLEPNFCHAKCYIFQPTNNDDRYKYFITGSSNLTEAGIGRKKTSNLELNIAETGNNNQYKEILAWFEDLWHKPQAHKEKTILAKDGTSKKIDFKQYLIEAIAKIFIEYSPRDIYYKILFELFGNQILEIENDLEFNRQVGRLENTAIFNSLYGFQKKGVLSLIRMLQKYDGAILADAVGLGKTWSALAVMKFFQMQGREVILLCPKKLESNWNRYKENQESKFESDKLKFFMRFHTDMSSSRLESYSDRADKFFPVKNKPVNLFVTPHQLGNFETFEELFEHFPPMLSGYQPAFYLDDDSGVKKDVLRDEKLRDR